MIKPTSSRSTARLVVWHAQFKTSALANKAGTAANRGNGDRRNFSVLSVSSCSNPGVLGIVGPEDTCLRRERRRYGRQATDISTLKPEITGEDKKGGVVEIDFNLANSEGVNMNPGSFRGYSRRDGDADFKFLACRAGVRRKRARDTSLAAPTCRAGIRWRRESDGGWPTYVDNPDTSGLVAGKPELREYIPTRRDVGGDVDLSRCSRTKAEVSQFSDQITVNCAPLV